MTEAMLYLGDRRATMHETGGGLGDIAIRSARILGLRLTDVRCFARHVANIDPETEVPPAGILPPLKRAKPYVYSDAEIDALLAAALALPPANGLRRWTYHYLFGLIAVIIRDISLCPAGSARKSRGTSIATGENIRRRPW